MASSKLPTTASLSVAAFFVAFLGAVQPAHSLVRLGVDGVWIPLSADRVETRQAVLDSTHKLSSFGGAVHANLGFDIFSIGLKVNYFNEGLELEQTSGEDADIRRDEVDLNLMGRFQIPATKVAITGEGGISVSTKFDGLGYNWGVGAEYRFLKLPLTEFQVGAIAQYVNLPARLNGLSTDNETGRLLLYVGADFGP